MAFSNSTRAAGKAAIACLFLSLLASSAQGHMMMMDPAPRSSKYNPGPGGFIDYSYTSPLAPAQYPCKGYAPQAPVKTYQAGTTAQVTIVGGAPHNGGHCQFAIAYGGSNKFVVLSTVIRTCMQTGSAPFTFNVPIPASAPAGTATFAWTWINASGNREYYMNCADVTIANPSGGSSIAGPQLLVADLPGVSPITFGEFGAPGVPDGHELFDQRPIITVSASGGVVTAPPSQPTSTPAVPTQTPAPTTAPTTPPTPTQTQAPSPDPTTPGTTAVPPVPTATPTDEPVVPSPPATTPTSTSTPGVPLPPQPTPPPNGKCDEGDMVCVGKYQFATCSHNIWIMRAVPAGTKCQSSVNHSITLVHDD